MAKLPLDIQAYLNNPKIQQLVIQQIFRFAASPEYIDGLVARVKQGLTTNAPRIDVGGKVQAHVLDIKAMVDVAVQKIVAAEGQAAMDAIHLGVQQQLAQMQQAMGAGSPNAPLLKLSPAEKARRDKFNMDIRAQEQAVFDSIAQDAAGKSKKPTPTARQLQDLPGGQYTAQRLTDRMAKLGVDPDKATWQIIKIGEAITRVQAQFVDANGVITKVRYSIDSLGGITAEVPRRLESMGDAIVRDTFEFMKWSIAISLILVPLQKLGELSQEAIENQTKLTNVLISLGEAQKDVNQVFQASMNIAQQTGESVGGVIDAYALAYRATGGAATSTERFSTASKLLGDSLILSKLSALDQAESIDILSAALKQASGELIELGGSTNALENGQILLDRWVKTTKIANVSLETLATSFSIVSDAAGAAGLDIDELNGVIATLSEVTGDVSGKEIGNMARALVSGLQSDRAVKELQSLGIAIYDLNGEARSFMDIFTEISDLRVSGVINETQLKEITSAIGGGTRRQAIVQAFIEQLGRVKQVSEESASASGDAMMALEEQLDTVATASTRLANAFSSLAQTLGTKGGLLDMFKSALDMATGLVGAIDKVAGSVGRMTPMLGLTLGGLGGLSWASKNKPEFSNKLTSQISTGVATAVQSVLAHSSIFTGIATSRNKNLTQENMITPASVGNRVGKFATQPYFLSGLASATILGTSVASNLRDSTATREQKSTRVIADVVGGAIGAYAGAALGGPAGMAAGTAIGASIAESFVNNLLLKPAQFEDLWGSLTKEAEKGTGTPAENAAQNLMDDIFKLAGQNQNKRSGIEPLSPVGKFRQTQAHYEFLAGVFNTVKNLSGLGEKFNDVTASQLAFKKLTPEQRNRLYGAQQRVEAEKGVEGSAFSAKVAKFSVPTGLIDAFKKQIMDELLSRQITPTTYKNYAESLAGSTVRGAQYYAGFGKEYGQATGQTQAQVMEDLVRTITYANSEELDYLTSINSEIAKNYNTMQIATRGTKEYNDALAAYNTLTQEASKYLEELNQVVLSRKELPTILDYSEYDVKFDLATLIAEALKNQLTEYTAAGFTAEEYAAKQASFPEFRVKTAVGYSELIPGLDVKYLEEAIKQGAKEGIIAGLKEKQLPEIVDLTEYKDSLDINAYIEKARQVQAKEYAAGGFTPSEYASRINEFESFLIKIGEDYSNPIYQLDPKYLADVIAQAAKEGIIEGSSAGLDFQTFDMSSGEFAKIIPQYKKLLSELMAKGYKPDNEKLISVFNDGIFAMEMDWKIVQYLLGKIEKNTADMTGVYNLPSGANFYIPSQAAELWRNTKLLNTEGGGGGGGGALSEFFTDFNTDAIENLLSQIGNNVSQIGGAVSATTTQPIEEKAIIEESVTKAIVNSGLVPDRYKNEEKYGLPPDIPTEKSAESVEQTILSTTQTMLQDYFKSISDNGIWGTFIETLKSMFNELFPQKPKDFEFDYSKYDKSAMPEYLKNILPQEVVVNLPAPEFTVKVPDMKASLNFQFASNTTLLLDGRMVANVVKQYLKEDMTRFSDGNTTINGTV